MSQKTVSKGKHNDSRTRAIQAFAKAFGISPATLKQGVIYAKRAQEEVEVEDDFEEAPRTRAKQSFGRAGTSAKQKGFVKWLRETAEQRHERKRVNRALAKAIRDHKFASAKDAMNAVRKHTNGGDGWLRLVQNAYAPKQARAKKAKFSEFEFDSSDEDDLEF
jgi:hypothetical protein